MLNLNQSNYEFPKHFILPLASKQELKRHVIPKIIRFARENETTCKISQRLREKRETRLEEFRI